MMLSQNNWIDKGRGFLPWPNDTLLALETVSCYMLNSTLLLMLPLPAWLLCMVAMPGIH